MWKTYLIQKIKKKQRVPSLRCLPGKFQTGPLFIYGSLEGAYGVAWHLEMWKQNWYPNHEPVRSKKNFFKKLTDHSLHLLVDDKCIMFVLYYRNVALTCSTCPHGVPGLQPAPLQHLVSLTRISSVPSPPPSLPPPLWPCAQDQMMTPPQSTRWCQKLPWACHSWPGWPWPAGASPWHCKQCSHLTLIWINSIHLAKGLLCYIRNPPPSVKSQSFSSLHSTCIKLTPRAMQGKINLDSTHNIHTKDRIGIHRLGRHILTSRQLTWSGSEALWPPGWSSASAQIPPGAPCLFLHPCCCMELFLNTDSQMLDWLWTHTSKAFRSAFWMKLRIQEPMFCHFAHLTLGLDKTHNQVFVLICSLNFHLPKWNSTWTGHVPKSQFGLLPNTS